MLCCLFGCGPLVLGFFFLFFFSWCFVGVVCFLGWLVSLSFRKPIYPVMLWFLSYLSFVPPRRPRPAPARRAPTAPAPAILDCAGPARRRRPALTPAAAPAPPV